MLNYAPGMSQFSWISGNKTPEESQRLPLPGV